MVHHIVLWKLLPEADGRTKPENAALIKEKLEALPGKIDLIRALHVGINENGGEYDVALVTEFLSKADLAAYDAHPDHQQVREFVRKVVSDRACVDFTV